LKIKADTIFWITVKNKKKLATLNNASVNEVYNEKLIKMNGKQYNLWNPYTSKLAAAIVNGMEIFPILKKTKVLYLNGTIEKTLSHISDIIGVNGKIFILRDINENSKNFLENVMNDRTNVFTITRDNGDPAKFSSKTEMVNVVYVDITQHNETEVAIQNCKRYLRDGGFLMLVVPTKKIDFVNKPNGQNIEEIQKLQSSFEIIQQINLTDFFKEHSMIIAKFLG
tara:strand:+ start:171 stop:845 length:675 start_codon:yes stop_codon:yes gene_type:complete